MSIDAAVESAVKRDRVVVLAALSTVVALSWAYLLAGAGMNMSAFEMTHMTAGGGGATSAVRERGRQERISLETGGVPAHLYTYLIAPAQGRNWHRTAAPIGAGSFSSLG